MPSAARKAVFGSLEETVSWMRLVFLMALALARKSFWLIPRSVETVSSRLELVSRDAN